MAQWFSHIERARFELSFIPVVATLRSNKSSTLHSNNFIISDADILMLYPDNNDITTTFPNILDKFL